MLQHATAAFSVNCIHGGVWGWGGGWGVFSTNCHHRLAHVYWVKSIFKTVVRPYKIYSGNPILIGLCRLSQQRPRTSTGVTLSCRAEMIISMTVISGTVKWNVYWEIALFFNVKFLNCMPSTYMKHVNIEKLADIRDFLICICVYMYPYIQGQKRKRTTSFVFCQFELNAHRPFGHRKHILTHYRHSTSTVL